MLFDKFEDENCKDERISLLERLIIKAGIAVIKLGLNSLKKAKTYGEFNIALDKLQASAEEMDEILPDLENDSNNMSDEVIAKVVIDKLKAMKF